MILAAMPLTSGDVADAAVAVLRIGNFRITHGFCGGHWLLNTSPPVATTSVHQTADGRGGFLTASSCQSRLPASAKLAITCVLPVVLR